MKKVFFPGSFNPFTKGHADILKRLLSFSEEVTIGIGININKPESAETAEYNLRLIADYLTREGLSEKVKAITYTGLTAKKALETGADCIARGVRNSSDFDYEYSLACLNREAFGIETLLIPADPSLAYVSSTSVRDLIKHNEESIAERYLP